MLSHVRSSRTLLAVTLLSVLSVGCGGDDDDGPMGPSTPQIGGAWTYGFSNITGSSGTTNVTCSAGNVSLDINQTGTSFTGSYFAPLVSCTGPGGTFSDGPFGGAIVNGSISGNSVSFDFDTSDWHQAGSLNGNSMNGTVTIRIQVDTSQLTLSGNWSAARTSNVVLPVVDAPPLGSIFDGQPPS